MFKHTSYFTVTTIRFQFRRGRSLKTTPDAVPGKVQAIITIEGQKPSGPFCTSIQCTKAIWDSRRSVRPPHEAQVLTKNLVKWEESIYSAAKTLFDEGEPITAKALINEKNCKASNIITLTRLYNLYIDHKKSRIGSRDPQERHIDQISHATYQTYIKRWAQLRRYLQERKLSDMPAHKADGPFAQSYFTWLRSKEIALATATKYSKLLNEILNWGVSQGLIRMVVCGAKGGSTAAVKPPYNITEEEVNRIEALEFSDSKMRGIRDGWLLARELCLHFSDYAGLLPEHFSVNKENKVVFEKARQKQQAGRNLRQISYVSERALSLWKRYGYKIPYRCNNAEFNTCLKEIGFLAGLSQPLMFSHARDSGIFRWVAAGVPDVQTRLAAGWRTTRELTRYVNFDRRLLDELSANQVQGFSRPLLRQGPQRIEQLGTEGQYHAL